MDRQPLCREALRAILLCCHKRRMIDLCKLELALVSWVIVAYNQMRCPHTVVVINYSACVRDTYLHMCASAHMCMHGSGFACMLVQMQCPPCNTHVHAMHLYQSFASLQHGIQMMESARLGSWGTVRQP